MIVPSGRLVYEYSGNKVSSLRSTAPSGQNISEFSYDNLGRMTSDGLVGQTFSYNSLDLVGNVSRDGATLVNYFYLADGTKTRALDGSGEGLVYRGPFVYRKGSGSSSLTLESAAFGGGRLTPSGAMLYVTDYLGSVRAVIDGTTGQIYKAVDYSAYGDESEVALAGASVPSGMTLRDSFTGQEDQTSDFGTSYTDFGARQYSPALRRWMTPDPLSEKYYGMSPYVFCADNPVNFVDPDGEHPVVVGAVIGGTISGTAAIIKGKSFTEVITATAGGAVDGAIAASGFGIVGKLGKFAGKLAIGGLGAMGGGVGDIVEQGLNVLLGNKEKIDFKSAGVSAAMGMLSSEVADTVEKGLKSIAKSTIGSQSAYEAVEKEVKAKIKSTGRTPKPSTVKSLVKTEIQGMEEASSKTIHVSVEVVDGSIEFYNEIFDNDE